MTELRIAADLALPLDFVTQTSAILARRRRQVRRLRRARRSRGQGNRPLVLLDRRAQARDARQSPEGRPGRKGGEAMRLTPNADGSMMHVEFDWSTKHGECYDCGAPAAYRLADWEKADDDLHAQEGDEALRCSVCAALAAADGEGIVFLNAETNS